MAEDYPKGIISDANVLIDYIGSNEKILLNVSKEICNVYVPLPILREAKQMTETKRKELGVQIFEPTMKQIIEASQRGGPLSFEDKLCFTIARDKKWACVTNDRNLREKCISGDISVMWGFDLMLLLNQKGKLSKKEARDTANIVKSINSFIKIETINEFVKKLT